MSSDESNRNGGRINNPRNNFDYSIVDFICRVLVGAPMTPRTPPAQQRTPEPCKGCKDPNQCYTPCEPMTARTPPAQQPKEYGFLLLHYQDGAWHNGTVPFKTKVAAEREIQAMKDVMPPGYFDDVKFVIIPNDGEAQAKYRPLDYGDVILYD